MERTWYVTTVGDREMFSMLVGRICWEQEVHVDVIVLEGEGHCPIAVDVEEKLRATLMKTIMLKKRRRCEVCWEVEEMERCQL
jgi:hypothetical protein